MKKLIGIFLLSFPFLLHAQQTIQVNCSHHAMTDPYSYQSGWKYDTTVKSTSKCDTTYKWNFWHTRKNKIKNINCVSIPPVIDSTPVYTLVNAHDTLIAGKCDSAFYVTNFGALIDGSID